jgi:hypothetical protein
MSAHLVGYPEMAVGATTDPREATMRKPVRMGAAGLAVAVLTAGCAAMPSSSAAPPTGGAVTASKPTGAAVTASNGPTDSLQEPDVTAQEAQAAALDAVGGGWILETKIEERDDEPDGNDREPAGEGEAEFVAAVDVWEVTVVGPDGLHHKVSVAMTDGSVLDSRVDD